MIDWVTALVPVQHNTLHDGEGIVMTREGAVKKCWLNPLKVVGSYESSFQVKTQNLSNDHQTGSLLYIHGNPSKFLQGHNVIGSDDINYLVAESVKNILAFDGQQIDEFSYQRILSGDFELKRVDINYMYELPTASDVRAWLNAAAVQSSLIYRGKAEVIGDSVYWGLGSSYWFAKSYSKFDEIMKGKKSHKLPDHLMNSPLLPYTQNKLRLEIQLNNKELQRIAKRTTNTNKLKGSNLGPSAIEYLFNNYIGRIEMNNNAVFRHEEFDSLPLHLRGTVAAWQTGRNMRDYFDNRMTFSRHRREIKRRVGVDIGLPYDSEYHERTNVVPLIRILEAKPASIPDELKQYCVGM